MTYYCIMCDFLNGLSEMSSLVAANAISGMIKSVPASIMLLWHLMLGYFNGA